MTGALMVLGSQVNGNIGGGGSGSGAGGGGGSGGGGPPETPPLIVEIIANDGDLSAFAQVTGGTPPAAFVWSVVSGDLSIDGSDTLSTCSFLLNSGTEGVVRVDVTDAAFVTTHAIKTLTGTPVAEDLSVEIFANEGEFSVFAQVTGGTAPFTFLWSVDSGDLSPTGDTTVSFCTFELNSGSEGVVRVVVTDAAAVTAFDTKLLPN